MKKYLLAISLMSFQVFGQSLECQLLRDEILTEARQRRQQNSEEAAAARGFAAGQNLLGGLMAQNAIRAERMGQGLRQAFGQEMSFEQKIQVYQQACEK